MANTLVAAGDIEGYGATHDEDLVVPVAMLDRNPRHSTNSTKQQPSRRPSSWKTKKIVVLGLMIGVMAATVFVSVLRDSSAGPSAPRTGPEAVLLQHYPYVTITNKTPYDVLPQFYTKGYVLPQGGLQEGGGVSYTACESDFMYEGLPAGQTWTASSRGLCLVNRIHATLGYHTKDGEFHWVTCDPYTPNMPNIFGTSYSIYSVLMKGDDACCVLSSHEIQKCPAIVGGMPEF